MGREYSYWERGNLGSLTCLGWIQSVDVTRRICTVQTIGTPGQTDNLLLDDVKILHNAWHPQGDEETYIPRVNSYCVILFVNAQPFIVGYVPFEFDDGNAAPNASKNQEELQPGDKTIATIAGNRVTLRSGGAITVESTSRCNTYWIPTKNLITSVCDNLKVETSGGRLLWTNPDEETDLPEGASRLDVFAIDNYKTPQKAVRVQMGTAESTQVPLKLDLGLIDSSLAMESVPGVAFQATEDGAIDTRVKKQSYRQIGTEETGFYAEQISAENLQYALTTPSGSSLKFVDEKEKSSITLQHSSGALIQISKEGKIVLQSASGNIFNFEDDNVALTSKDGAKAIVKDGLTLIDSSGSQTISVTKDGNVQITASKDVTVSAPKVAVAGGAIDLGSNPSFHSVIYEMMASIFDGHMHATAMGPSGPPLPPMTMSLTENNPAMSAKASYVKIRGNLSP
jgi:hypothetical protein